MRASPATPQLADPQPTEQYIGALDGHDELQQDALHRGLCGRIQGQVVVSLLGHPADREGSIRTSPAWIPHQRAIRIPADHPTDAPFPQRREHELQERRRDRYANQRPHEIGDDLLVERHANQLGWQLDRIAQLARPKVGHVGARRLSQELVRGVE